MVWLAVTAAALAVVVILEVAEAAFHIPAAAPAAVAAVVGLGRAAANRLALVSGRQDRCKA